VDARAGCFITGETRDGVSVQCSAPDADKSKRLGQLSAAEEVPHVTQVLDKGADAVYRPAESLRR